MTLDGFALLDAMADIGFGLDINHMTEAAAFTTLDHYPGIILATHSNTAALLKAPDERFLNDLLIRRLVERDGVIGVVPANKFLRSDWQYLGGRQWVWTGQRRKSTKSASWPGSSLAF